MSVGSWRERAKEIESEVYALYLAARDDRTPIAAKALIWLIVAYAVSPIDPIPDFIPGLGYLDEVIILPLGVRLVIRLIPDSVLAESRQRADEEIDVGKARWIGLGLTLLLWLILVLLVLRVFGIYG